MQMQLGRIGVWGGTLGLAPRDAIDFAQRVDALGYSALWTPEAVGYDPFVHAGLLLDHTERLVLATGIANIYARDPQAMVCAARTLAAQSGGRFVLGIGVSHKPFVEDARGHTYEKPVPAMRRYLDAMERAIWVGPEVEPVPVVIGALRERMLALSAERTRGAHPYLTTPEHTRRARAILGPDAWLCVEQKLLRETDPVKARMRARESFAINLALENYQNNFRWLGFDDADFEKGGSDRLVDALVGWGDEATLRARVDEHLAAGASHVCINAVHPSDRAAPDIELLEMFAPG